MKVLILEQNPQLAAGIEAAFAAQDVESQIVSGAPITLAFEKDEQYGIVFEYTGKDWQNKLLMKLRDSDRVVAIVVYCRSGEVFDRCLALELGADDAMDHLTLLASHGMRELCTRVKAVARRKTQPKQSEEHDVRIIERGDIIIDLLARSARRGGKDLHLTAGECDLLIALARHPHVVMKQDELLRLVRNREPSLFDRTIDVQIGRLRRKLGENPQCPRLVKTVRGAGYIFIPDAETRH